MERLSRVWTTRELKGVTVYGRSGKEIGKIVNARPHGDKITVSFGKNIDEVDMDDLYVKEEK